MCCRQRSPPPEGLPFLHTFPASLIRASITDSYMLICTSIFQADSREKNWVRDCSSKSREELSRCQQDWPRVLISQSYRLLNIVHHCTSVCCCKMQNAYFSRTSHLNNNLHTHHACSCLGFLCYTFLSQIPGN